MTNIITDTTQIIAFIGIMAFIVSVITEAVKRWEWFDKKVPTALTVIILSLVLCPVCMLGLLSYYNMPFIVALVAMDGWERVSELAERLIRK